MSDVLVRVEAPHFVAGMVLGKTKIVDAAPILRWTIGKSMTELKRYFNHKKWKFDILI